MSNILPFRITPLTDPIFPHKSAIHVGSRFTFHGRTVTTPTLWVVEQIFTETRKGWASVFDVHTLRDILTLRLDTGSQMLARRFSYLSYSAIWRHVP